MKLTNYLKFQVFHTLTLFNSQNYQYAGIKVEAFFGLHYMQSVYFLYFKENGIILMHNSLVQQID